MPDKSESYKRLEERIEYLEFKVQQLEKRLEESRSHGSMSVDEIITIEEISEEDPSGRENTEVPGENGFEFGEGWLNRIGIGLLLLGVAFLFKFSIDQGWLIPPVRSLIGLGIGLALFLTGLQLHPDKTPMKQILLGGGLATFYVTGFATFQLYNFVMAEVVWVFMIIVTLLSLSLSLQQGQSILSVIGVIGGLGTPFMLYTGEGNLTGLIAYTSLVISGGALIYLYKGWKVLLWSMVIGFWAILAAVYVSSTVGMRNLNISDQYALQIGIFVFLAFLWGIPVLREVLVKQSPEKWLGWQEVEGRKMSTSDFASDNIHVNIMVLTLPVISFLYSMSLWELSSELWGAVAMTASLPIGYLYLPLKNKELPELASIHAFTALILLTSSFFLLVEGNLLFVILALEGLGLRILAKTIEDENVSIGSHILFGILAIWLIRNYTFEETYDTSVFNLNAFTNLFVIGLAGFGVPRWLRMKKVKMIYLGAAHLAILGWFLNELVMLENGQAYVSVSWGIYAIVILIMGFLKEKKWLRRAGMGTIFLVVGKLFLVDLSQLQALWRILLFIGFGATFLFIGYYVQQKFDIDKL